MAKEVGAPKLELDCCGEGVGVVNALGVGAYAGAESEGMGSGIHAKRGGAAEVDELAVTGN